MFFSRTNIKTFLLITVIPLLLSAQERLSFPYRVDDGPIFATALQGHIALIGGGFNTITNIDSLQTITSRSIAAFSVHNKQLLLTASDFGIDRGVFGINAMCVQDTLLFLGGGFTLNNQYRSFACLHLETLAPIERYPIMVEGNVECLTIYGDSLFLGGWFSFVGDSARNNLACINWKTGEISPWKPAVSGKAKTVGIKNNTIYVGGDFTAVNDSSRNNLTAFDLESGNLKDWAPRTSFWVNDLGIIDSSVYIGGLFTEVNSQPRNNIAALDGNSGELLPWAPSPDSSIRTLAITGNEVYIGGTFTTIDGVYRDHT